MIFNKFLGILAYIARRLTSSSTRVEIKLPTFLPVQVIQCSLIWYFIVLKFGDRRTPDRLMGTPKRKINGHHCCFGYSLGRNVRIILELFRLIDVHDEMALNDVQFCAFMKTATDLNTNQIYKVFDMLDVDGSGAMDFDEFYLLICILIAVQDKVEKNFIYRHSRTVFDLLDEDNSGNISAYEFETFGFLFNLQGEAIRTIFREFDVSGDQVCNMLVNYSLG